MKLPLTALLLAALLFSPAPAAATGYSRTWSASAGLLPDTDCFWHLITTNPALATLGGGSLQIATGAPGDGHYYYEAGADLAIPDPWVIEARVRVDTDLGTGQAATSAAIGFATAADVENILFIGAGQIYLWSSYFVIGPQATLDTQSAFHTYRIEVTAAGAVSVFYDGTLTLSGVVYFDIAFEDSTYLWWGDGTSHASGTSHWEYLAHNGHAFDGCPTPVPPTTWGGIKGLYGAAARAGRP